MTSICVARNASSVLLSYKTIIHLSIYSQYRKMCSDYFHLIQSHTLERSPTFYNQNIPRTSAWRERAVPLVPVTYQSSLPWRTWWVTEWRRLSTDPRSYPAESWCFHCRQNLLRPPAKIKYNFPLPRWWLSNHFSSASTRKSASKRNLTRMHSSRMRTGHSLTVCQSLLPGGGGWYPFMHWGRPPVNRMTNSSKNITLATTSLRPVIILWACKWQLRYIITSTLEDSTLTRCNRATFCMRNL